LPKYPSITVIPNQLVAKALCKVNFTLQFHCKAITATKRDFRFKPLMPNEGVAPNHFHPSAWLFLVCPAPVERTRLTLRGIVKQPLSWQRQLLMHAGASP